MDKKYWDEFYKKHGLDKGIQSESTFANFCQNKFFKYQIKNILELGSGNGRDAKYFAKCGHNVIAIDQSHSGVEIGKEAFMDNVIFIEEDFVNMDYNKFKDINVVYSRFTIHAITEEEENIVISKVTNLLKKSGIFAIEVRSTKDPLYGVGECVGKNAYVTTHYRRFIDSDEFVNKLLPNYKLLYFTEEDNLSIYKEDNPVLIRLILEKR
jgi:tellurite methyltransferase